VAKLRTERFVFDRKVILNLKGRRMKYLMIMIGLVLPLALAGVVSADSANQSPEHVNARPTGLRLANIFSDGMVLQRDRDVRVWGWGEVGEKVAVSLAGNSASAVCDQTGKWMLTLPAMSAGGPHTLVARGKTTITVKDILIGEVWICSGQSNMDWKVNQLGERYDKELAQANLPRLRLCSVGDIYAASPQSANKTNWQACTPERAREFSAVAYFFGNKLLSELDVPIGLVECARGGSPVEAWICEKTLRKDFPEFKTKLDTFPEVIKKSGGVFDHRKKSKLFGITQKTPSVLYNGYIHPLIPFTIRGVIWYQGESNVQRPEQYRKLFPAMIHQWRADWNQGDFPFYYVQIAPCGYKDLSAAYLREAQMMALSVPNTGMAVTMDLGDEKNIHPPEKKPVGERLARIALAKDYGRKNLVFSGPVLKQTSIEKNNIRLTFDHVADGLASRDGKPLSHFTIAGKDLQFVEATAVIDGESIVVSSPAVPSPVAVRFAWGSADIPNLMNKQGLPASSFRTDQGIRK
jgi:sialate O-acetylesterase